MENVVEPGGGGVGGGGLFPPPELESSPVFLHAKKTKHKMIKQFFGMRRFILNDFIMQCNT